MRIVACITDRAVLDRILTHLHTRATLTSTPGPRGPGVLVRVARVWRCVRMRSRTARSVMHATIRIVPPHPARAGGVPAVLALSHLALVGDDCARTIARAAWQRRDRPRPPTRHRG